MSQTAPAHGDKRHHGTRTDHDETITMQTPDGRVAYQGPGSSRTYSVSETYCGYCKQWIPTNGVMGPPFFAGKHQDGECSAARKAADEEGR